jgi:hypothetical protein
MQLAARHACRNRLAVQHWLSKPAAAAAAPASHPAAVRTARLNLRCYAMGKASTSLSKRLHVFVSGEWHQVAFAPLQAF